ncbi:MAG: cell division protein FtsQ [Bermanella sp.]
MKGKGATRLKSSQGLKFSLSRLIKPISIGVTVLSIMFAVVLLVLQVANKEIKSLEVSAPFEYVLEEDIRDKLKGIFPNGYVSLDVEEIHQRLLAMPMVASVEVEKVWPDTLAIRLQEEQPVAIWNETSLLSQAGDILPVSVKALSLPRLMGAKKDSRLVMQHHLLFNRWCKRHNLNLVGLTKSTSGWLIEDQQGLKIWLDGANAMSGLRQLESVIGQFELARIKSIDMRYEQGFAVAWKAEPAKVQG